MRAALPIQDRKVCVSASVAGQWRAPARRRFVYVAPRGVAASRVSERLEGAGTSSLLVVNWSH